MPSKVKALSLAVLLGFSGSVLAGLGNVQVHSRLGEPFYAVIPLTGQTAKDAVSPELPTQEEMSKFSIQGSSVAGKLDFRIVRKNKNAYVQVRSSNPINEPILTFGVKVSSNSGTASRQYTAMLDPRGYETQKSGAVGPAGNKNTGKNASTSPNTQTTKARSTGRTVYVEEGDTLSSIAARFKPARMSLANTRRAILLANPKAFVNGNPTRIKKGATIRVPSEAKMRSLIASSNKKIARPTVKQPSVKGTTTGNTSAVTAPTTSVDNRQVEELRSQLTQEQTRIAKLEKELQDAKNKLNTKPEPKSEIKPEPKVEVKPEIKPEPKLEEQIKTPEEPDQPTIISNVEIPEVISTPVETAISEVVVEEPKPRPKPRPRPPMPVEPEPEPSFLDGLLENPLIPIGGLLVLLGGAAGVVFARKRRKNKALESDYEEYGEDTFFNMNEMDDTGPNTPPAGGSPLMKEQKANAPVNKQIQANANQNTEKAPAKAQATSNEDSKAASTFMSDFTRMSAAIDSVEIDPLSEAEVYIAYGRTDEAEEILKDALSKDPAQHEVRKKLLEIYASRQEIAPFTSMAKELYDAFDGRGALWQEVSAMGRQLDPNNPLYAEKSAPAAPQASAPVVEEPVSDNGLDMDFGSLDEIETPTHQDEEPNNEMAFSSNEMAFSTEDFESKPVSQEVKKSDDDAQEFSFNLDTDDHGLEFDLDAVLNDAKDSGTLDESVSEIESFDFNELDNSENRFSLDDNDFEDDPAAAKLELAKVYLDMGDADGAREALTELLEETENPALRAEAQDMLGKITS